MKRSSRLSLFPDINVWVALTYDRHVHHFSARRWFEGLAPSGRLFFCRPTQLGLLRLLTAAAVMGPDEAKSQQEAWKAYDVWLRDERVEFLDESSGLEAQFRALTRSPQASPKDWADSKFVLSYEHMALVAAQAEKWQELVDISTRELGLNPRGTLDIWYYKALGNYHLRKWDIAEASAIKSLSMDPSHVQPNTEQLLGVTLAEKHDFAGALQHLRNCLTYFPPGPNLKVVRRQIAQIESAIAVPK